MIEHRCTASADAAGMRLDAYLATQSELALSRAQIQRLCREGHVGVDGQVARPARRLNGGEQIVVELQAPVPSGVKAEAIPLDVVYEDEHLLVVNKARGMVVHPAPGHRTGTLVNAVLARCPDLPGCGDDVRPGIVHRLDKDTTGLIVVAKDAETMGGLARQLASHAVARRYLALVHGVPPVEFAVDAALGRDPLQRKRIAVLPEGGRAARTHFEVRERFVRHALVVAAPETGRTHQIRVHLRFAGHPVVADPLYGRRGSDTLGLGGQALHAWQLSFTHPLTGALLRLEAAPPPDFVRALEHLRGGLANLEPPR